MEFLNCFVGFLKRNNFSFDKKGSTFLISLDKDFRQDSFMVLVLFLMKINCYCKDSFYSLNVVDKSSVEVSIIPLD